MRLTEIENPLVRDSSKPLRVRLKSGRTATVTGYTPAGPLCRHNHWWILIDGDSPGDECPAWDAEIIED